MTKLKNNVDEFINEFCHNHTVLYKENYYMTERRSFNFYEYIINKEISFECIINDHLKKDTDNKGKYIFIIQYAKHNKNKFNYKAFKNEYNSFPSNLDLRIFLEEIFNKCHNAVTFIQLKVISYI